MAAFPSPLPFHADRIMRARVHTQTKLHKLRALQIHLLKIERGKLHNRASERKKRKPHSLTTHSLTHPSIHSFINVAAPEQSEANYPALPPSFFLFAPQYLRPNDASRDAKRFCRPKTNEQGCSLPSRPVPSELNDVWIAIAKRNTKPDGYRRNK